MAGYDSQHLRLPLLDTRDCHCKAANVRGLSLRGAALTPTWQSIVRTLTHHCGTAYVSLRGGAPRRRGNLLYQVVSGTAHRSLVRELSAQPTGGVAAGTKVPSVRSFAKLLPALRATSLKEGGKPSSMAKHTKMALAAAFRLP